jgi:hypothetical protein
MQLCLFKYALVDWLIYVFCMVRITFGGGVVSWSQYCSLSLSGSGIKRKTFCIVRKGECIVHKGEKQIQILDGY